MATREELLAELQRRQSAGQGQSNPPAFNREAAIAELQRRQQATVEQQMAAKQAQQQAAFMEANRPEKSFSEQIADAGRSIAENVTNTANSISTALSTGATIASATAAEPIAGLAGLASLPAARIGKTLGLTEKDSAEVGSEVIKTVRNALTINPNAGAQEILQSVAQNPIIQTIGNASATGSQATGDFLADLGEQIAGQEGRAIGGSLGKTAFAGGELLLGGAAGRGVSSTGKALKSGLKALPDVPVARQADLAIQNSIPEAQDLKRASSEIFKEIDKKGVNIKNSLAKKLVDKIDEDFSKTTFNDVQSKKTFNLVNGLKDEVNSGKNIKVSELDSIRKSLGAISRDIGNNTDATAAKMVMSKIDGLYDTVDLGKDFKSARNLFFRGLKTNKIDDVIENSKNSASGFEKGLQVELRKILRSTKESKKFNDKEKALMKDIVRGEGKSKVLNLLSKFDIGSTDKLRMTGLLLSGAAGLVSGGAAVALPILGKLSSIALEKFAKNRANVLKEMASAGDNAREIAKTYIKNTPSKDRSPEDLTALLLKPEISVKDLKNIKQTNETTRKAVGLAKQIKELAGDTGVRAGTVATAPLVTEKEGNKPLEIDVRKSLEELKKGN